MQQKLKKSMGDVCAVACICKARFGYCQTGLKFIGDYSASGAFFFFFFFRTITTATAAPASTATAAIAT